MTSKVLQDLLPNRTYAVQVRSKDKVTGEVSEWSNRYIFVTDSDAYLPATPTSATWVVSGDSFYGEWDAVTTNTNGEAIAVVRYEVELVSGATTRVVTVPQKTNGKPSYSLSFEDNRALFTTPQPAVTMRVRAVDNKDIKSAYTTGITATNPAPAAPTAPAVGSIATPGVDSVALAWTPPADTDLIGYNVYMGASSGFTPSASNRIYSGGATRFTYTTTTYSLQYYKIRAVDKFGQESPDLTANATPVSPFVADTTPPAVPVITSAPITTNANGVGATASVTWTQTVPSPDDLAGFTVRWRKVGDTNYFSTTVDKDARNAVVDLPQAYAAYEFQVRSFDWKANYSAYTATTTTAAPANAVPANVTGLVSTAGRDSIVYSWNATGDNDIRDYEVTFSTSNTFPAGASTQTFFTGTSTTLTVGGLTPNTTYYARVRAVDTGNSPSAAWSATDTETTGTFPTTPLSDGNPPASSPTPNLNTGLGYLYATWAPATNADPVTYDVHLGTTSGFTPGAGTKVSETSGTFALIDILPGTTTALSYGQDYYVKLVARDRDGSAASSAASNSAQVSKVGAADSTITPGQIGAATPADIVTNVTSALNTVSQQYVLSPENGDTYPGTKFTTVSGSTAAAIVASADALGGYALQKSGTVHVWGEGSYKIPFDPNVLYKVTGRFRTTVDATNGQNGVYIGITGYAADKTTRVNTTGGNTTSSAHYVAATNRQTTASEGWVTVSGYVKGWVTPNGASTPSTDPTAPRQLHANVRYMAPMFILGYNGGDGTVELSHITIEAMAPGVIMSSNYNFSTKTGFALSENGLNIWQGTVSANVLEANSTITNNLGVTGTLTISASGALQSSNYVASTSGYKLSASGLEINNGSVKASALIGDTLGSSTGTINIAAGANIIVNGGYIKSNTYTGTAYTATPSAGWYIGNDGIAVGGTNAAISASALIAGTISGTNTITLSGANARIVGTGFTLAGTGLTVTSGSINAAALNIQTGQNLMPPEYADFEAYPTYYTGKIVQSADGAGTHTWSIETTLSKYNSQSLKIEKLTMGTGTYTDTYLAPVTNPTVNPLGANIDVETGKTYIISFWGMTPSGSGDKAVRLVRQDNNNAALLGTQTNIVADGTWQRVSATYAPPAGATRAAFRLRLLSLGVLYIDGIQFEERVANSNTPSSWTPPVSTRIVGDTIRTGSIQSSVPGQVWNSVTNTLVNDPSGAPAWIINTAGNAVFRALQVKGSIVVGDGTEASTALATIASSNYVPGATGWRINSDGTSEFRQMKANSIRGESIITDTLDVSTLKSSNLNATITLLGGMVANGVLGEEVSLSGAGFSVYGPHEVSITNRVLANNVVTITTGLPHGYVVGQTVIVSSVGAPFDGTWTVASVPSTTTYTYAVTNVDIGTAAATGLSQGKDNTGVLNGPKYIEFPTDGTQPNIISGQLTSDFITVTEGATLRGTSNIERGGQFVINSAVKSPVNMPTVSSTWDKMPLKGIDPTYSVTGITLGANGNIFAVSLIRTAGSVVSQITEHNVSTGAFIAQRWSNTSTAGSGAASAIGSNYFYPMGLVYHAASGKYLTVGTVSETTLGYSDHIFTLTLPTSGSGTGINGQFYTGYQRFGSGWDMATIGVDTDVANQFIYAYGDNAGGGGVVPIKTKSVTVNATTGVATAVGTVQTYLDYNSQPIYMSAITFAAKGVFDYGTTRTIISGKNSNGSAEQYYVGWVCVFNAGTMNIRESWPVADGYTTAGFYGGGKFKLLTDLDEIVSYETGTGAIPTTTDYNKITWYGYTWYDSQGTTQETTISPFAAHYYKQRSKVLITIPPIPSGAGGVDDPNSARVYSITQTTKPTALGPGMALRVTIPKNTTTGTVLPGTSTPGTTPPASSTFTVNNPGQIMSATGNSYWKGDDTAKFYQLVLDSNTDANTLTGNMPALRIGPPTGSHTRMDGNEVISMDNDTTQGTYYINIGGPTRIGGGRGVTSMDWGTRTCSVAALNTTYSATVSLAGSFVGTPTIVLGVRSSQPHQSFAAYGAATNSSFTLYWRRADNTNDLDVGWLAMGGT